jgi:hypothetical protein
VRRDGVGVPIDFLGMSSPLIGVPASILSVDTLPLPFLSSFVLTEPALLSSSVSPSSSFSSLPPLPRPLLLLLIELSSVSDSQLDSEKLTGLEERRPPREGSPPSLVGERAVWYPGAKSSSESQDSIWAVVRRPNG